MSAGLEDSRYVISTNNRTALVFEEVSPVESIEPSIVKNTDGLKVLSE